MSHPFPGNEQLAPSMSGQLPAPLEMGKLKSALIPIPAVSKTLSDSEAFQLANIVSSVKFDSAPVILEASQEALEEKGAPNQLKASPSDDDLFKAYQAYVAGSASQGANTSRIKTSAELAGYYRDGHGALGVARDLREARKLNAEAAPEQTGAGTQDVYDIWNWFSRRRLWAVRLNRSLGVFGYAFLANRTVYTNSTFFDGCLNAVTEHLQLIATVLSLSYFAEIIFDLGVMGRTVFFPEKNEELRTPSASVRLSNTFWKGNRAARLFNAARWGGSNFASSNLLFLVTPLVSDWINVLLFASDFVEEISKQIYFRFWKHPKELKLIDKVILGLEVELTKNQNDAELLEELEKWQAIQASVIAEHKKSRSNQWRLMLVTGLVLTGTFFFLPHILGPAFVAFMLTPGALTMAIRAVTSVVAFLGSMIGGYGFELYNGYNKYPAKKWTRADVAINATKFLAAGLAISVSLTGGYGLLAAAALLLVVLPGIALYNHYHNKHAKQPAPESPQQSSPAPEAKTESEPGSDAEPKPRLSVNPHTEGSSEEIKVENLQNNSNVSPLLFGLFKKARDYKMPKCEVVQELKKITTPEEIYRAARRRLGHVPLTRSQSLPAQLVSSPVALHGCPSAPARMQNPDTYDTTSPASTVTSSRPASLPASPVKPDREVSLPYVSAESQGVDILGTNPPETPIAIRRL